MARNFNSALNWTLGKRWIYLKCRSSKTTIGHKAHCPRVILEKFYILQQALNKKRRKIKEAVFQVYLKEKSMCYENHQTCLKVVSCTFQLEMWKMERLWWRTCRRMTLATDLRGILQRSVRFSFILSRAEILSGI